MIKELIFNGLTYFVSDCGKVYGKNNQELKQRLNSDGYPCVTLGNKRIKRSSVRVHRLVCSLFVENIFGKPEVNHIDGNKQNNSKENLEWSTRQEQIHHAFKLGLMSGRKGSKNGRAVLSELDAIEIRKMKLENIPISKIAEKFGVGWTTVSHVIKNETWK